MRISSPPATREFSYYWGAGRVNRASVQCYYCYQFGHYQNSCPLRLSQRAGSDPPPGEAYFPISFLKVACLCFSLFNGHRACCNKE